LALIKEQALACSVLNQKNVFFDTPERNLYTRGIILRLRRENNSFYLCAKKSHVQTKLRELAIRDEYEQEISAADALILLEQKFITKNMLTLFPAIHEILNNLNLDNLAIAGFFTNLRNQVVINLDNHNFIFELDISKFPDDTLVYELEIEFESAHDAQKYKLFLENYLREAQINFSPGKSKSARLFLSII
jgi:uncharacterized protein YjbK